MDAMMTSYIGQRYDLVSPGLRNAHIVTSSDALDVAANLQTEGGIETTRWFIQEQDLGVSDQSTSNTQSLLLTSTQALLDGCANNRVCLRPETEAIDQIVDALESFLLGHSAVEVLARRGRRDEQSTGQNTWEEQV